MTPKYSTSTTATMKTLASRWRRKTLPARPILEPNLLPEPEPPPVPAKGSTLR
jgi:hypothetical protein